MTNKVAIVTGASSGIGEALARLLAQESMSVVLAARRIRRLELIADELRSAGHSVLAVQCDVTKARESEQLIHNAVEQWGRLDILVNNAGRGHFASVEDTTDDVIERMFALNVFALWYTTRPAIAYMKRQGSGHIINIASMAGKLGYPYNSAYVAAKHACVGFTLALRAELLETGIHATVVCPAGVKTDWASSTEGAPMLPMFSESGPHIKRIAAERGISLPPIEGVLPPEAIAAKIIECIHHPVAEVYTHKGSREFAVKATEWREAAEYHQLPVVLGERLVYEKYRPAT